MKESSMLTTYVKTPLALEQYRSGPAGPHLDAFISRLEEHGYQRRRIPHLIRGVKRFSFALVGFRGLMLQSGPRLSTQL
jgi:hypothetical protein